MYFRLILSQTDGCCLLISKSGIPTLFEAHHERQVSLRNLRPVINTAEAKSGFKRPLPTDMGDSIVHLRASPINVHVDNKTFSDNPQKCAAQIQKILQNMRELGFKLNLNQQESLQKEIANHSDTKEQKVSSSLTAQLRGVQGELSYLMEEGKRYNISSDTSNFLDKENQDECSVLSANGLLSPKKPFQKPRRPTRVRAEDTANAVQTSQSLLEECQRQHELIVEKDEKIKSASTAKDSLEAEIQLLQIRIRDTNDLEGESCIGDTNLQAATRRRTGI